MSKSYDQIAAGLREAIAHAKGEKTGVVIHEFEDLDVAAVRAKTSLSQNDFARTFGMRVGTLRNWEQRRRVPDGPARVLLTLIDRDPIAVLKTLRGKPAKRPTNSASRPSQRARRAS